MIRIAAPGSASIASRRRKGRRARAAGGATGAAAQGREYFFVSAHRVVFTPSGKRGEFPEGTSLLAAARALGVDLDSVCGGRGICGRCQIEVAEGAFAKHATASDAGHATPWNAAEQRYADKRGAFAPGRRLGCQARVCGDLVIDVPPE